MTDAPAEPGATGSVGRIDTAGGVDKARIEKAVREILLAIGEDPGRDGLVNTPARVARMYAEICSGLHEDPAVHLHTTFEAWSYIGSFSPPPLPPPLPSPSKSPSPSIVPPSSTPSM